MAPAAQRLKRRAEFLQVAAKGRKAAVHGGSCCKHCPGPMTDPPGWSFTVTKKVGNAVIRNRTRRRLKEAARLLLRTQPLQGVDLVLIGARRHAWPRFRRPDRRSAPGAEQGRRGMTPAASVLAGAVRVYQWTIRPVIGAKCRFEPSCSHYAIEALGQSMARCAASALAAKRILRCNPWHEGGDDPVPAPISSSPASSPSPTPGRTAS